MELSSSSYRATCEGCGRAVSARAKPTHPQDPWLCDLCLRRAPELYVVLVVGK